jgi:5-carboxymethyl-2-hydroxymuconate isomerase
MPHIIVEYSSNLRDRMQLGQLIQTLHETAIQTGVFPLGGTRTRAAERTDYRIADGHPDNAFVNVTLRIGHGRDAQTKQRAAQTVFDALCTHLAALYDEIPLGISFEVQEIEPTLSFKKNNLHDYVTARAAGKQRP